MNTADVKNTNKTMVLYNLFTSSSVLQSKKNLEIHIDIDNGKKTAKKFDNAATTYICP